MESLVSINITVGDKLINPTKLPILFYWDGNNDLYKLITSDETLREHIKDNLTSFDDYNNCVVSYFYFKFEGDEEKYTENNVNVNRFMTINDLHEEVVTNMLYLICIKLYSQVFGKEYDTTIVSDDPELVSVHDIYDKVLEKYGERVTKETFVNYIISKSGLTEQNKEILQQHLNEMF